MQPSEVSRNLSGSRVDIFALTASADVVDDDAVTGPYAVHAWTDRLSHARGLVAADHSLIRLWARPKMLSVDGTQVTAADRRRAHSQNHLTVSSTWIRNLANIDLTATWEENTPHNGSVPAYWTLALNIGQLTCCFVTTDAGSVALQVTTTKIAVPTRRLSTSPGERSHMVETHHRAAFRFAESGNPFNHTLKRKVSGGVRRRPKMGQ
jgi:hypothetical protein